MMHQVMLTWAVVYEPLEAIEPCGSPLGRHASDDLDPRAKRENYTAGTSTRAARFGRVRRSSSRSVIAATLQASG